MYLLRYVIFLIIVGHLGNSNEVKAADASNQYKTLAVKIPMNEVESFKAINDVMKDIMPNILYKFAGIKKVPPSGKTLAEIRKEIISSDTNVTLLPFKSWHISLETFRAPEGQIFDDKDKNSLVTLTNKFINLHPTKIDFKVLRLELWVKLSKGAKVENLHFSKKGDNKDVFPIEFLDTALNLSIKEGFTVEHAYVVMIVGTAGVLSSKWGPFLYGSGYKKGDMPDLTHSTYQSQLTDKLKKGHMVYKQTPHVSIMKFTSSKGNINNYSERLKDCFKFVNDTYLKLVNTTKLTKIEVSTMRFDGKTYKPENLYEKELQ